MGYLELAKKALEKKRQGAEAPPRGQPVPPETLEAIFQEVLEDLNRRTLEGLLGGANTAMLDRERQAKDHLDRVWREALVGRATLETFGQAVRDWHASVLALFSVRDISPTSPETGRLF